MHYSFIVIYKHRKCQPETIKNFTAVKKLELKEGITGSYLDLKSVSGRHPKFCAKLRKVAVKN